MVKTYLVCVTKKFKKDDFLLPMQIDLLEDEVEGEALTSINQSSDNFHIEFEQYKCHHDFKHNKSGRVFQQNFSYYFEPLNFYTYHNSNENLAFIRTKTEVALDFIEKLNTTGEYDLKPIEINFEKMIPHIDEIGGAWFANLRKAHLKSAGYFGPHVNKSEEYKEAAREGHVSSIQINYINRVNSNEYTVLISKKGSIVLYDRFETLEEELELVDQICARLIRPHVVT